MTAGAPKAPSDWAPLVAGPQGHVDPPVVDVADDDASDVIPPAPRPVRAAGIDIARGIAMLGMVSVHVSWTNRGWWSELASGRAAVLFFTLSGLTASMLAQRGTFSASAGQLRRRGIVLFLGGMTMMSTIWPTTILHVYGLMFLAAPWLLRRRTRILLAVAVVAFAVGPILVLVWNDVRIDFGSATVVPTVYLVIKRILANHYALLVWTGFFTVGVGVARVDLSRRQNSIRLASAGVMMTIVTTVINAMWAPVGAAPDVMGGDRIDWAEL